jgi:hypothetical protein
MDFLWRRVSMRKATISLSTDAVAPKRRGKNSGRTARAVSRRDPFLEHLDQARRLMVPLAGKKGIYTDEDVFKIVS